MRIPVCRPMPVVLLAAFLLTGGASPSGPDGLRAQSPLAERPRVRQATALLEAWLDGQRAHDRVPGLSAAVVHDQEVVWIGAFGLADRESGSAATPETIYSVCSISKLFTSLGVMQLRDEGRLRLDDPVGRHLPWFTLRQTAPEWGDITIEGMLTHSSGLPRESDHPYWTGPEFPFPTAEAIRDGLSRQETLYPAEQYFQYSNLGMALLGEIVAARAGTSYTDYITRRVLTPLGMSSTTPEIPAAEHGHRMAVGYGSLNREGVRDRMPLFQARGIAAAAGYASTAGDLAAFLRWQFRLLRSGTNVEVLRAPTLREMHRVHWVDRDMTSSWGLGFAVWRNDNRTFVGHGGSCPGYRSQVLLDTEHRIGVVVLANAMINTGQYAQNMYGIMAPALRAAARDTSAGKPVDASLARYAGRYSSQPWGSETLIVPWEDGLASVGLPSTNPMGSMTRLRRVDGAEHTFRRVRSDDTLGETWIFSLDPDGRATHYTVHNNHYPRLMP